jgi:hypothetical protein
VKRMAHDYVTLYGEVLRGGTADVVLNSAATARCDVSDGSLQFYDGEKFRAVALHGLPEALDRRRARHQADLAG